MIIKKMDSKQEEIAELTELLKGRLTSYQRFMIERELKAIKSGTSGEKDSANLRRFADLLEETNDHDRIMKIEVLRELGQFDQAISLLAQPFGDELSRAVSIIKDLVAKKDPLVTEITSG